MDLNGIIQAYTPDILAVVLGATFTAFMTRKKELREVLSNWGGGICLGFIGVIAFHNTQMDAMYKYLFEAGLGAFALVLYPVLESIAVNGLSRFNKKKQNDSITNN